MRQEDFRTRCPTYREAGRAVLEILHAARIPTFVMVAPLLPRAGRLAGLLSGKVDHALLDRYSYHYVDRTYQEHGLQ